MPTTLAPPEQDGQVRIYNDDTGGQDYTSITAYRNVWWDKGWRSPDDPDYEGDPATPLPRSLVEIDDDLTELEEAFDLIGAGYVPATVAQLTADVVVLTNAATIASDNTVTCATAAFTNADVGKVVHVGRAALVLAIPDAVATSGSRVVTSATGGFTSAMQGKTIVIPGAGAAGGNFSTTVQYVVDSNTLHTASNASTTVASVAGQITKTLATTISAVNSPTSIEVTVAPTATSTGAGLTYGTDNTAALLAAIATAGTAGTVVLTPGSTFMLGSQVAVDSRVAIDLNGSTLMYGGDDGAVWLNKNGIGGSLTIRLRNGTIDGNNCGEYGLKLGTTVGSNKAVVALMSDVLVTRFNTVGIHAISTANCRFTDVFSTAHRGGIAWLFDALTSSSLNTAITAINCRASQSQVGIVAKDLRTFDWIQLDASENVEEGILIEQQASTTFLVRAGKFDRCRIEGNVSGSGVTGTGRAHVKASSLGNTTQIARAITFQDCSFSGASSGDYDLSLHGGIFTLHGIRYGSTATGFGGILPAVGSSYTQVNEDTDDQKIPDANMPGGGGTANWTVGAGAKLTMRRMTDSGFGFWLGDGAAPTLLTDEATIATLVSGLAGKAALASPTFTGTPAAPTAAPGTNTTQLATTAFVTAADVAGDAAVTAAARAAIGWTLPTGAKAQTYPRSTTTADLTGAITSGTLRLAAVYLWAGDLVSSITWVSGTTGLAAAAASNQHFSLWSQGRALLGVTNDDTGTAWAASSAKTLNLATPYTVLTSGLYYLGIVVVAGAPPSLRGVTSIANINTISPKLTAQADAGLTTPGSLPATAAALVVSTQTPWAYCS